MSVKHMFAKIFEFAASAGSLEGYVYHKQKSDIIRKLKSMVKGSLPESADDFQKKKWFR